MKRHTSAVNGVFSYLVKRKGWTKHRRYWGVQYRDPVTWKMRIRRGFKLQAEALDFRTSTDRQHAGLDEATSDGLTFADALDRYRKHWKALGRRDSSYEYLDRVWLPAFGKRPIAEIRSEDVEELLEAWHTEKGWSPQTRNTVLNQLSGLLSHAYGRRWIHHHPIERGRVHKVPVHNARQRWLRPDEISSIRAGAPPWLQDIITLAAATGLRLEVVCAAKKADLQEDAAGNLYLFVQRDKNGQPLYKMLEGPIAALARRHSEAAQFPGSSLFPGPGGGNARTSIRRFLPVAVRAAGLRWGRKHADGVTFHTLRHSMASIALNVAKVPEHMVRRMGAWQDARMVGRYGHLADEELRKAELAVARIVAGPPAKAAKRRPRARA